MGTNEVSDGEVSPFDVWCIPNVYSDTNNNKSLIASS